MEQTQVGHYRIERLLGQGGMGAVYEAQDLKLGRRVALKFIAPGLASDDESLKRFEREAKSAAALNHSHIATLYALERERDQPFISMELLKGRTLRTLLVAGPLPIEQATTIVRDVASALAYAHSRGIVHRDIKPENLMFDEQQRIKITDFGLAKAAQSSTLTQEGTSLGTPQYMAPECAHGQPGSPADVFALGAVLYELNTGRPPFLGSNPLATMYAVATQETPRLRVGRPEAPEALEALVTRMLSKAAEERPTAAQVAAALGAASPAVSTEAVTEAMGSQVPSMGTKARRLRGLTALLVVLGLAIVGVLAFTLIFWPGVRERRHQDALKTNNRGMEAMNQGRFEEAGRLFHQALELDPSLGIAMNNLGMVFEHQGKVAQAESILTAVLRRFPSDRTLRAQALYNLGTIDLDTGAWESAVKNLGASFELDSSTARAYNNFGLALVRQGRAEEALAVLIRGITRFPVAAPLHKNAGLVLVELGRPREALPHLDRALAIDSLYTEARDLREQAARGEPKPMSVRATSSMWSLLVSFVFLAAASPAGAQPYARFDVPDSLLETQIAKAGGQFESAWNALLVAELRATAARADSARRLGALARRIAAAEEPARGTRIAATALALRGKWSASKRGTRIRAAVRESIGVAAQAARRWNDADSLLRMALADYRSIGEHRREAWVLGTIGQVAFTGGDIARADSVYRLALVARQRIGDAPMIGNTLNSLGTTRYLSRDYAQARMFLEGARTVREKTGERGPLGATLNSLGLTLVALGQPDSARGYYERALEMTVAAGDSLRTAEVLTNAMRLLADEGKLGRALELGERAKIIQQEQGNPASEARLRLRLGDLRRRQGRFAEASDELDAAASLARDAVDVRALLDAVGDRGRLALVIGDYEGARPLLLEAARLADSLGDASHQASALNNLAQVANFEGDQAEAERFAMRALEQARAAGDGDMEHLIASTLGNIAMSRRDAAAMARWYGEAAADSAVGPDQRAPDLNSLAIAALENGDADRATALFQESVDIALEAQLPDLAWPPLLGLGEVAERRGDFGTALARTRQAVSVIDSLRATQGEEDVSITVLADRSFAGEALIHLLTKLQPRYPDSAYAAEAFTWAERMRARSLAHRMRRGGPSDETIVGLSRLRTELPKGTAFLEYSLGDSSSSLWLVTRGAAKHFKLPTRGALRGRVEILRRSLADPTTAESPAVWRAARSLHQQLIGPAEADLKGIKDLVISPDGLLALVPFEALLRTPVTQGPPPPDVFLVSRFTVSYVPSATIYVGLARAGGAPSILALGDPLFRSANPDTPPSHDLPRLPQTAAELEALRRLAGKRPIRVLSGPGATRESLLAAPELGTASLLHLATHGEASEYEQRQAGLWLAVGEDGEPGWLSVDDVLRLRLRADLVTLSACQTGLGRVARGEGVLGLSRAFLVAGAGSVMVSLWRVNDQSTATLMEGFYQALLNRKQSAPQALAATKRRMLASPETRAPFHWAPFVLSGRPPGR